MKIACSLYRLPEMEPSLWTPALLTIQCDLSIVVNIYQVSDAVDLPMPDDAEELTIMLGHREFRCESSTQSAGGVS